jgi:hypothetical protein
LSCVSTGVCEGDPLSSTAFNLVVDSVIKKVGLKVISSKLKQLIPYADDVILMTRTERAVIKLFNNLSTEAKLVGLCTNRDQAKYLHIERIGERNIPMCINNLSVEEVLI